MKSQSLLQILHPYVYTFGVLGTTGSGKTTLMSLLTTSSSKKVIEKSIGITNSTLVGRYMVLSEECTINDTIIVGVKKNVTLYKWSSFTQMLIKICTKVVLKNGKSPDINKEKVLSNIEEELKKVMEYKFNNIDSDALLSFLSEKDKKEVIELIKLQLEHSGFIKECYKIYCVARNSLDKQEVKDNSKKFKNALKSTISKFFDNLLEEIRTNLEKCCKKINEHFDDIFFKYFDKENISQDGYYFNRINLLDLENEMQAKFIDIFFNCNNLQERNSLSIEVFCSDIVIYIPMHKSLLELIKSNSILKEVFSDNNGKISIGFNDTQGFFHVGIDEELVEEYAYNLVYGQYDSLILLNPLIADTNMFKAKSLYSKVFENYNRDTPIFILNNKVDIFIDNIINESISSNDDIFTVDIPKVNVSDQDIIEKVDMAKMDMQNKVIKEYCKKVKNLKSFACYFKKSSTLTPELAKYYNVFNVIKEILISTAEFLKSNANRTKFRLESSEIDVKINRKMIKEILENQVFCNKGRFFDYAMKKFVSPSIENISNNLGITPHGNGYNALGRRLKVGQGYTSNIDESYYFECKSFSINFPANLRNLITSELLVELLKAVELEGGHFDDDESKTKFFNSILNYIYQNDYVVYLVYKEAFLRAEDYGYYSFQKRFDDFLKYSLNFIYERNTNIDKHVDAFEYMLKNATYRAIGYKLLLV